MKSISLLTLLIFISFTGLAVKTYTPTSSSVSGSAGYCVGATASVITCTYSTCSAGVGTVVGVVDTIKWYRTTVNATTGGTLMSTTISTCSTGSTGTATYTPSTGDVSVYYYYCKISWYGLGLCNGTGLSVCANTAKITVQPPSSPISGTTNVCTGLTVSLSDTTSGGAWSSSNTI